MTHAQVLLPQVVEFGEARAIVADYIPNAANSVIEQTALLSDAGNGLEKTGFANP
jgi:hypothetical protein